MNDRIKRFLLPTVTLAAMLGAALVFRSFFITFLVEPVAQMLWSIWRLVSSVDQNVYWLGLIAVSSLLIIILILSTGDSAPSSAYMKMNKPPSQFDQWQQLLNEASLGDQELNALKEKLRRTYFEALDPMGTRNHAGKVNAAANFEPPLSPAAQRFLIPAQPKAGKPSLLKDRTLLTFVPRRLRRWVSQAVYKDDKIIDEILHFLENELEIDNEQ